MCNIADVLLYEDHLVLFVSESNIKIFLISRSTSNELLMDSVIQGFLSSLQILLKNNIDVRGIIDNMDYVLLAIDELCDNGIIFETDGDTIASRVLMKDINTSSGLKNDQTLMEVWEKTKGQWLK